MSCWNCHEVDWCLRNGHKCKQCPDCNYVYYDQDECPKCREYYDFDPESLGLVVPHGKEAQELLAWDDYYKRGFEPWFNTPHG